MGAFDLDEFDETVAGKVLEAVIDGGEGDAGGSTFDAVKDIVGSGVVGGFGEDLEDFSPMGSETCFGAEDCKSAIQGRNFG